MPLLTPTPPPGVYGGYASSDEYSDVEDRPDTEVVFVKVGGWPGDSLPGWFATSCARWPARQRCSFAGVAASGEALPAAGMPCCAALLRCPAMLNLPRACPFSAPPQPNTRAPHPPPPTCAPFTPGLQEGVAVCPTADRRQRIPGRLSLIKQYQCLFLCWLPYAAGAAQLEGSATGGAGGSGGAAAGSAASGRAASGAGGAADKDRSMYAVHPVPLSDIKALRKHTPALGHHHVTLTLASGVSLPPLFFHSVSSCHAPPALLR